MRRPKYTRACIDSAPAGRSSSLLKQLVRGDKRDRRHWRKVDKKWQRDLCDPDQLFRVLRDPVLATRPSQRHLAISQRLLERMRKRLRKL